MIETESIIDTPVETEMRNSFLEYAMSVIVSRALPDVRDGMKPVHRRILYSMYDMGIRPGTPYKKCARTVGECMGKLHPHGDSAIYEAMVRMAQDFSMRLPLVDGHGNFGSLGNDDPPAAMRYTEARLAPAAMSLLSELSEDTVDFRPNYDGQEQEPEVLPAAFPNLLVNGGTGIAVGMATNMVPHNLVEVVKALRFMLENESASLEDVTQFILGPDLPTGGIIIGMDAVKEGYKTGRGTFKIRSTTKIEDISARKKGIVITELPYTIGPERLISHIKKLQTQKRLLGVSAINDLSDRKGGLRIVIECKTGFNPEAVLEELYRLTPMEESFGVNNVCLVNNQPQTLGLLALCRHYLNHRMEVVTRRTKFRLRKAEARLHIVAGLLVALQAIDEVVKTIRSSRTSETARDKLRKEFKLSEIQANHILEMPLRRLTALEVTRLKEEEKELTKLVTDYKKLLSSEKDLKALISQELQEVSDLYGSPRRSRLLNTAPEVKVTSSIEIQDDPCLVTLSSSNLIARFESVDGKIPPFKSKPGKHDLLVSSLETTNRAVIGAVTDSGRLLRAFVVELPKAEGKNKGGPLKEFFSELSADEKIVGLISLPDPKSAKEKASFGIALATKEGVVKRITPDLYPTKSGQEIISIKEGDSLLGAVELFSEEADLFFVTSAAQLLRTPGKSIRPQGKTAGGVAGMKVNESEVIAFGVYDATLDKKPVLVTLSNTNTYKATSLEEYPAKGRGGSGVRCHTFKKGEENLKLAFIGENPLGVSPSLEVVSLPEELAKRDASGALLPEEVIAVFEARS